MLFTLTTTHQPATDLGFILRKNPDNVTVRPLTFGTAHVFWPEVGAERATAALLVEVDPVALSRRRSQEDAGRPLQPYVNDRPYVASSFLSVALSEVYGTALMGRPQVERPGLVEQALPLEATLPAVVAHGGPSMVRRLFEPLGYEVEVTPIPVEVEGATPSLCEVRLRGTVPVPELLGHLYVLLPVLDDDKHYWVSDDEVDKLVRHGEGWLGDHPARELIARRYLRHRRALAAIALARVGSEEETPDDAAAQAGEDALEKAVSLQEHRNRFLLDVLREHAATDVLDVGCGPGRLLRILLRERQLTRVVGVDASTQALERARRDLNPDKLQAWQRSKLEIWHGAATYRDTRLQGFDAAVCVEVIEHVDPWRLPAFADALFGFAAPRLVVLTTPNVEYNVRYGGMRPGQLRHADHRFEWTRAELAAWAGSVAEMYGYDVTFHPVGVEDEVVGAPCQAAVFVRRAS